MKQHLHGLSIDPARIQRHITHHTLGGLGDIGKNMMVVEYDEDLVLIDAGSMFPVEETPGIRLMIPDLPMSWKTSTDCGRFCSPTVTKITSELFLSYLNLVSRYPSTGRTSRLESLRANSPTEITSCMTRSDS